MKKNFNRILVYMMALHICVYSIVITGCTLHKKTENESLHQNRLEESRETIKILEQENMELKKENKDLQKKLTQAMSEKSKIITHGQALTDMINIYELYKSGMKSEAADEFKKIEPMGFDDSTLAYYEILKDVLGE